jgi:hypothetical protein
MEDLLAKMRFIVRIEGLQTFTSRHINHFYQNKVISYHHGRRISVPEMSVLKYLSFDYTSYYSSHGNISRSGEHRQTQNSLSTSSDYYSRGPHHSAIAISFTITSYYSRDGDISLRSTSPNSKLHLNIFRSPAPDPTTSTFIRNLPSHSSSTQPSINKPRSHLFRSSFVSSMNGRLLPPRQGSQLIDWWISLYSWIE